ncbi:MAG: tRNA-dihydrouridine synthase family protein [Phycisphaerae bacterium]|nr:tRNA-dihydrouridine synthase family protein [Phycisphaerae bacterium]MDD5381024.1 tRNA-dihydrouridine synthase family protein [Phycisphaerae bacterium]
MLRIGNINLDIPYFQAALAGYSDYAMRTIARDCGAPLVFAGAMLAKSVIHPKVFNSQAFKPGDDEHPIGAQLLGEEPEIMAKAAMVVSKAGYDLIDLNFACPAPKVIRRKRGGFFLNEPDKAIEIYNAVRESVDCPVTMKLRTSFDNQSYDNFWDIASRAVAGNVDALIVHPRAVCQRFTGQADWQFLSEVKKRFPRTIIFGSGDLFSVDTIKNNIKETGVDGVAIARGAIGNPWIFRQLRDGDDFIAPTLQQQGQIILKHFSLVCKLYEHKKAIRYFRKFAVAYCKIHPSRKKAQKALFTAKTDEEFFAAVKQWYSED